MIKPGNIKITFSDLSSKEYLNCILHFMELHPNKIIHLNDPLQNLTHSQVHDMIHTALYELGIAATREPLGKILLKKQDIILKVKGFISV